MDITIDLAKALPSHPFGRYHPTDGDSTGERFRESVLKDALSELEHGSKLLIDFTGLSMPVSSAFLSEAFYGCVKRGYSTAEKLRESLVVVDESHMRSVYKSSIERFIHQAEKDMEA
ncbi:conserved hypothetical protein [Vibrio chagasii]|nr:conserved hypothetical protein [Vibrio chagasii]